MKITVKNLQQQTFTVEVGEDETVLELKKIIYREKGDTYLAEKQKLIYAGVILDDERTILSYNIDPKKFVVVMLKRDLDKSATKKTNDPSNNSDLSNNKEQSKNDETTKDCTVSANASIDKESNPDNTSSSNIAGSNSVVIEGNRATASGSNTDALLLDNQVASRSDNMLLMGEDYNRSVESITEMGYSRDMVERAMAASFNNPERAVEYLINGIPSSSDNERTAFNMNITDNQSDGQPTSQSSAGGTVPGRSEASSRVTTEDPFEFLRNQPQFLQMRSLIHHNPELLHAVLQQIGQTNPALLQLISENQDAFLNMLNQPIDEQSASNQSQGNGDSARRSTAIVEDGGSVNAQQSTQEIPTINDRQESQEPTVSAGRIATDDIITEPQGVTTIQLSPRDQDAIERLKALGFPEPLVLQAYFACDKDEQLAANFLISSSFDD